MAVLINSRYATGRTIDVTDARNGATREFLYTYRPFRADVPIQAVHTVARGERLDQLAHRYAGDSRLWWVIAEVNDVFGFPLILAPGTKLRIPAPEVFREASEGVLR